MTPRTPSQPMRSPTSRIGHLPQGSGLAILGAFLFACPAGAATLAPPPAAPCVCAALPAPVIEAAGEWPGWGIECPQEDFFDKAPWPIAGDAAETTDADAPAPWEASPVAAFSVPPSGGSVRVASAPGAAIAGLSFRSGGGGFLALPVTGLPGGGPAPPLEPPIPSPPAVPLPAPALLLLAALAALILRRRPCPTSS